MALGNAGVERNQTSVEEGRELWIASVVIYESVQEFVMRKSPPDCSLRTRKS